MSVQIIETDENTRYVVDYDTYYQGYQDVTGDCLSVSTVRVADRYTKINNGKFADEITRIVNENWHDRDKAERIALRYLALNNQTAKAVSLQGYSQGEWADVIAYADNEDGASDWLDNAIDSLKAWWRGDIYTISKQTKVTYANVNDPSQILEQWETEDAIGGILLTDDYTIEQAIGDCF